MQRSSGPAVYDPVWRAQTVHLYEVSNLTLWACAGSEHFTLWAQNVFHLEEKWVLCSAACVHEKQIRNVKLWKKSRERLQNVLTNPSSRWVTCTYTLSTVGLTLQVQPIRRAQSGNSYKVKKFTLWARTTFPATPGILHHPMGCFKDFPVQILAI